MKYIDVALPIPKRTFFSYALPESLEDLCQPGSAVLVPVGKGGDRIGIVWAIHDQPSWQGQVREIRDVLHKEPLLNDKLRRFLDWIASYYIRPIGMVMATAIPSGLLHSQKRRYRLHPDLDKNTPQNWPKVTPKADKIIKDCSKRKNGLMESTLAKHFGRQGLAYQLNKLVKNNILEVEIIWHATTEQGEAVSDLDAVFQEEQKISPPPSLTSEQDVCCKALDQALDEEQFKPFLIHGITGSGKTEVYLHAVKKCLEKDKQALLLVPEIALTPQLIRRYRNRLKAEPAVLHSGMSEKKRLAFWHRIHSGQAKVVIGARSALFAPLLKLGLIVVDEEHENAYKQEGGVPYQARDMAVVRSKQENIPLILGSATPSLESLYNASEGKYQLLKLTKRATGATLPKVEPLDLSRLPPEPDKSIRRWISPELRYALKNTLNQNEQSLLFLNRRGFSSALFCHRCGEKLLCPHCSVTLTFYKRRTRLICHYCNYSQEPIDICPACGQFSMGPYGPGTEQLEEEVQKTLPKARILRLDRNVVSGQENKARQILTAFAKHEADILIGTQMVAKGHHFPKLNLVGIVLAEGGLSIPDFRASERTFQLITQVAGRAGRIVGEKEHPAKVLVQTYDPEHYTVSYAMQHDLINFAEEEKIFRESAEYPPFNRIALFRFSCRQQKKGEDFCEALSEIIPEEDEEIAVLGPSPAPLEKLRDRFRWQLLVKEKTRGKLHRFLTPFIRDVERLAKSSIRWDIDIDPYSFI
ncbi:replication restart helicase PriA [Magnetococcales bacterium HHB-1]